MKKSLRFYLICLLVLLPVWGIAQRLGYLQAFAALETSPERIVYINRTFAHIKAVQYDSLLTLIQARKDRQTELFWHHRKHISLDVFPLTAAEKEQNLEEMRQKAQKYGDEAAEIVAALHGDFLKNGQRSDSVVSLYYRNLERFDRMKAIGFSCFAAYDLNLLLWEMGKELAQYWQPEKGLDFLLLAKTQVGQDTVGQFYHSEVLSAIRNCYYHMRDSANANAHSRTLAALHQALNPQADPKRWWSLYWQARATLEIATLYLANHQFEEAEAFMQKGIKLYRQPFDLQTATRYQLLMEYEMLEELTNLQITLGHIAETKLLLDRMEAIQQKLDFAHTTDFLKIWGLYRDYEKYYLALHDYKNAYLYNGKMDLIYLRLYERNAQNQLEDMRQVHQLDKYSQQIQTIEKEKQQQRYLAAGAILLALLISTLSYVVYRRIKKDKDLISSQKIQLESSLEEKEILLREIHHRVKNNLQIVSGLLEKQATKTTDELTQRLMREGQSRVLSMALVHEHLYQSDNLSSIEIKSYLEALAHNIQSSQGPKQQNISLALQADDCTLGIDTVIPLGLILNELITNCYKYAFEGRNTGRISVLFERTKQGFQVAVSDDGKGLPADFDLKKTKTLGLYLVNGLVRQLGGSLSYQAGAEGTCFSISCPL